MDSQADPDFLSICSKAARVCGVTRLADVTGLDRIGLPVWQAVRPASRSLSVHQGKSATHRGAMIGALCEAIESHSAEIAPADGPCCRFDQLDPAERAGGISDYCRVRDNVPAADEAIPFCSATDLVSGRTVYLPHACVSLDYTVGLPSPFDRSSTGLGAGPTERDAAAKALLECVERDALGEWQRLGDADRQSGAIDLATIPFEWFGDWRERLRQLDVALRVDELESIAGLPTFRCEIGAQEEFGRAYRRFFGVATDGDAEIALFRAFAEAVQSRLTLIAGVRDDILPSYYREPEESGHSEHIWSRPEAKPWGPPRPIDDVLGTATERLASLGFDTIAIKRLDQNLEGLAVVKAFVPGLGSQSRTRELRGADTALNGSYSPRRV